MKHEGVPQKISLPNTASKLLLLPSLLLPP